MARGNPQTWARVTRLGLRALANEVGTFAALRHEPGASVHGAEAIRGATDRIGKLLLGHQMTSDLRVAFAELLQATDEFQDVMTNAYFQAELADIPMESANHPGLTLQEAISNSIEETRGYITEYYETEPESSPQRLAVDSVADKIPDQKLGPVRFTIIDGIVRVDHRAATTSEAAARGAAIAREELIKQAKSLTEALKASNQDPRLLQEVNDLQERLRSKEDVIALGIAAIGLQTLVQSLREELPAVYHGKMMGLSVAVNMYVAQFPDWLQFSERAAEADFSPAAVAGLYDLGKKLAAELRKAPSVVDAEVPRSIAFILETIRDPRRAVKRTVFASVRTLENFVSIILKGFSAHITAAIEGSAKATKHAAYITVTCLAAAAAVSLQPAAGNILNTHWLGEVGKMILENVKPPS